MKNQKNWEMAQIAFAHQMKVISGYTALFSTALFITDLCLIILNNDVLFVPSIIIQSIVLVGILWIVYYSVNKKLDE